MTHTLQTLFPIWAEHQPTRVSQFPGNKCLWSVCPKSHLPLVDAVGPTWIDYATVFRALTEEIAALGWHWEIFLRVRDRTQMASVWTKQSVHRHPVEGEVTVALLVAFLKALGAEV